MTLQLRRDTAANWTSANPTLATGQPGYETDTNKLKVGDGTTAWTSLPYFGGGIAIADVTGLPAALSGKSDTGHSHAIADTTGLTAALSGKSDTGHSHSFASLTVLPTTLAGYGITDAQPLDPDLTALAALTGTAMIYYRSAANTWSPVTIGSNLTFTAGTLDATGGGGGGPNPILSWVI